MNKYKFNNIKRILIIGKNYIGDQLMVTPFYRGIRKKFPDAYIACVSASPGLDILENNNNINKLLCLDENIIKNILKQKTFDMTISLSDDDRSIEDRIVLMSGSKYRIRKAVITKNIIPGVENYNIQLGISRKNISFLDYHREFLQKLGFGTIDRKTDLFLTNSEKKVAQDFFVANGLHKENTIVGIQALGKKKRLYWELKNFGKLADRIIETYGGKIIFLYANKEEKNLLEKMTSAMKYRKYIFAGGFNIRVHSALIEKSDIFISSDGGAMHIAVALNVPTVGIFDCVSKRIWFPYNSKQGYAVDAGLDCQPYCKGKTLPCTSRDCIKKLSIDKVFKAVSKMVKLAETRKQQKNVNKPRSVV